MSREIPPFSLRLPPELTELIREAAHQNRRSKNAEVVLRLRSTFDRRIAEPRGDYAALDQPVWLHGEPNDALRVADRLVEVWDLLPGYLQRGIAELVERAPSPPGAKTLTRKKSTARPDD